MSLLAEYPLTATADEDFALRVAVCRLLAAQSYHVPGAPSFTGYVADTDPAPGPAVVALACYPEWADGEVQLRTPAAVILDATGNYLPSPQVDDETPLEDGGSLWSPVGVGGGPAVTLREQGEYEVQFSVMLLATDRPTRSALVRGARAALTPSAASSEARDSLLVDLGGLYWARKARIKLTSLTRQDGEDAGGTKRRTVFLSVRASVIVVEPVELDLLHHVAFLDPADPDGELRAITQE